MEFTERRNGVVVSTSDEETAIRRGITFVVLTFALALAAYLPIIASLRGWIGVSISPGLAGLAIVSPAVAAILLHLFDHGIAGLVAAVWSATAWRFGRRWWVATLLTAPVIIGVSYAAYLFLGGSHQPGPAVAILDESGGLVLLPILIVATMLFALGEEVGWRGYLLPQLQTRYSAAIASLVVGVCWFLWHVPLRFLPGEANAGFPLALWATSMIALAFVYTWLFNNTDGSVLAVTVFHGLFNVVGPFVALHPSVTGDPLSAYVMAGVNVLFALAVLGVYGTGSFTRQHQATGRPVEP